MAMLAEPRRKQKIGPNPRGTFFVDDDQNVGRNMLQKMGWKSGDGLGLTHQGISEPIRPKVQQHSKGLGFDIKMDPWVEHNDKFAELLQSLNSTSNGTEEISGNDGASRFELEKKSKSSRSRIHYQKFVKNKDLSNCSTKDWSCIFGKAVDDAYVAKSEELQAPIEEEEIKEKFVAGGSMQDYFAQKFKEKKSKLKPQQLIMEEKESTISDSYTETLCITNDGQFDIDEIISEEPKKKKKKSKKKSRESECSPESPPTADDQINDEKSITKEMETEINPTSSASEPPTEDNKIDSEGSSSEKKKRKKSKRESRKHQISEVSLVVVEEMAVEPQDDQSQQLMVREQETVNSEECTEKLGKKSKRKLDSDDSTSEKPKKKKKKSKMESLESESSAEICSMADEEVKGEPVDLTEKFISRGSMQDYFAQKMKEKEANLKAQHFVIREEETETPNSDIGPQQSCEKSSSSIDSVDSINEKPKKKKKNKKECLESECSIEVSQMADEEVKAEPVDLSEKFISRGSMQDYFAQKMKEKEANLKSRQLVIKETETPNSNLSPDKPCEKSSCPVDSDDSTNDKQTKKKRKKSKKESRDPEDISEAPQIPPEDIKDETAGPKEKFIDCTEILGKKNTNEENFDNTPSEEPKKKKKKSKKESRKSECSPESSLVEQEVVMEEQVGIKPGAVTENNIDCEQKESSQFDSPLDDSMIRLRKKMWDEDTVKTIASKYVGSNVLSIPGYPLIPKS